MAGLGEAGAAAGASTAGRGTAASQKASNTVPEMMVLFTHCMATSFLFGPAWLASSMVINAQYRIRLRGST
jgi:hypothetical protein